MLGRICCSLLGASLAVTLTYSQATYVDVANDVGIAIGHRDIEPCEDIWALPMASGSAWADFDNDGDVDLFVPVARTSNHLYRNDGDTNGNGLPNFVDIAASMGVDVPANITHSSVFIDYDNDGDQDLYLTGWGENFLFQNQLIESGSVSFVDVTDFAGVADSGRAITTAWGDFDQDGYLDAYLAKHLYCDTDTRTNDRLFKNNGDGTFTDVTSWLCSGAASCDEVEGCAFSAVWADYDNDGDPDLYVANEWPQTVPHPNVLWRNDGSDGAGGWIFTDVSESSGADIAVRCMGLGMGDFNNDGWIEYAVSNLGPNVLLENQGDGTFQDISESAGIQRPFIINGTDTIRSVTWGTMFLDYDNNRLPDLLFVAGPIARKEEPHPDVFFQNNGDATFTDISDASGLNDPGRSRCISIVDFDNDGFVDLYEGHLDDPPLLLHNLSTDQGNTNHWLTITLEGTVSNRDAIGTRLYLATTDGVTQMRDITTGPSYGGGDYRAAFFGLGPFDSGDLTVRWPNGELVEFGTVQADQSLHLIEGTTAPPVISGWRSEVVINSGERFKTMRLDKYVDDPDDPDSTITWTWAGNVDLMVSYDAIQRRFKVREPAGWTGSETITLTATDPDGLSDAETITFTVVPSTLEKQSAGNSPAETSLGTNYPNPFNPSTIISYGLSEDSWVSIKVYNTIGQEITTLVDEYQKAGYKSVEWNGRNAAGNTVAAGVYIYQMYAQGAVSVQKMILTK